MSSTTLTPGSLIRRIAAGIWCLPFTLLIGITAFADEPQFNRDQLDFFEKQIRPVLASQCWNCHSETKQESGLRLDSRAAVIKGGDRGELITPGHGIDSLLVHALKGVDDLKMPPNGKLSTDQIAAFAHWIDQGLPWPVEAEGSARQKAWKSHWAFQPIQTQQVPDSSQDLWSNSPIDRFILDRLQAASISPSPRADLRTLIRRVTYSLTGLPPADREVREFVDDASPDAFDRLVDRLLASPRYGERWTRHWLDLARYADHKGYVFFEEPTYPWAYTYRDYVIRSFNEDRPYDQFVTEQLAADQIDRQHDDRSLAAMGFLTVGAHFMGNVHDIIDDRIDVVARGLMGLTVSCARCHDHKYDPIPTADYYALYGVFRSTSEPLVPPLFDQPPVTDAYRKFTIELSVRQQKLDDFIQLKHGQLVEGARTRVSEYLMAAHAATENPAIDDFMLIADPGDLNPAMIVRWQAYLDKVASSSQDNQSVHPVWGPWIALSKKPEAEFAAAAERYLIEPGTSTSINPLVVEAIRKSGPPKTLLELAKIYGDLLLASHKSWQSIVKDTVILKRPTPAGFDDPHQEAIRQEMYSELAPANVPQVFGWGFLSLLPDRASQGEYQKVLKEVEQWIINGPGAPPRAMVLNDAELYQPRVFQRGNPSRPGESVSRHFLTAFSDGQPFTHGGGRLDLAKKIVDQQNPLTHRVLVNRLWQWHFGAGLVRSPGDFGIRSDPPTHPELLDWLAQELNGQQGHRQFSLKRLHRLLLASNTYQQASLESTDSTDPENRLWHRTNRQRLDFEGTRDSLVFATGQLEDRIGGPSQNLLEGFVPRRTLYLFLNRLDLPNLLSVFDFPSPAATSSQRETTTISPQALYLMNGPLTGIVAETVQTRAELASNRSMEDRVLALYEIFFQRRPTDSEKQLAMDYLGNEPTASTWSQLIQALLVTNEFVFVD